MNEPITDEALWDFANDLTDAWNIEDLNPPSLIEVFRDRFVARFGYGSPQGEPSDDYEAGYAEGFHHGLSSPRGSAESDREQGEPSDAQVAAVNLIEETARAIFEVEYPDNSFRQLGEVARAFRIQQARAALSVFEKALSEPSDAQVDAALQEWWYGEHEDTWEAKMRAALRAAGERPKENRDAQSR